MGLSKPIAAAMIAALPGAAFAMNGETADLTPIGALQPEVPAMIRGTVDTIISYDEFVLVDGTGHAHIYIGPNAMPVARGETINVTGYLDDGIAPEFYAASITTVTGEEITLRRSYD